MPTKIEARQLTADHIGYGIQFGHDAGLTITDMGPGYEGNVKIGLRGRRSGNFVTEVHPSHIVTITGKES